MKKIIYTTNVAEPIGPYSQAIETNGTLYISGQIPMTVAGHFNAEMSIEEQTLLVLKNIQAILEAAGYELSDVVKTTIFLSDIEMFSKVNEVYAQFFNTDFPPARETVAVKALPKLVDVEISAIAVKAV